MQNNTNCKMGDDTPNKLNEEFIPFCESCGKEEANPFHGLCEKCAEKSEEMQHQSTQAWINESC